MTTVFPLWHVHEDDEFADDAKLIGIYESEDEARRAIARLAEQPGFRDHTDGFQFKPYELNKDHWSEGFVSVED